MTTLMQAQQPTNNHPVVKLRNVGDNALVSVTDYKELPATDIDGNPKFTSKGDRAVDVVITGVFVTGNPVVRRDGVEVAPTEGEQVTFWLGGSRWFQWLQACRDMKAPLNVGDMLFVTHASQEPPPKPSYSPKQIWSFKWGAASRPEHVAAADKARELHRQAQQVQLVAADADPFGDAPQQAAPAASSNYDPNMEPF